MDVTCPDLAVNFRPSGLQTSAGWAGRETWGAGCDGAGAQEIMDISVITVKHTAVNIAGILCLSIAAPPLIKYLIRIITLTIENLKLML
jgi:hypothetical protein